MVYVRTRGEVRGRRCTFNTTVVECVRNRRCTYARRAVWMHTRHGLRARQERFSCAWTANLYATGGVRGH